VIADEHPGVAADAFYRAYPQDDPLKRAFYEVEVLRHRWPVRELKRQINS